MQFEGTRKQAEEFELLTMGRDDTPHRATSLPCSEIYPQWIVWYKANRAAASAEAVETAWRLHLNSFFGKMKLISITRQVIEEYKRMRVVAGVKPRTVNKELNFLSGMLRWAEENELCPGLAFIIRGFPERMIKSPRPKPLTQDEITRVYEVIEDDYRLIFLLMADAGLRVSEARLLKREDLDYERGYMVVVGKGNKERVVPITTDRLARELEKHRDTYGYLSVSLVTGKPYLKVSYQISRAARRAGIERHVHPHLLRHSFGTNGTIAGLDLSALQAIMGHSSPNTTGIYQHLAGEYIRKQGRKMNDMVISECPHGLDSK